MSDEGRLSDFLDWSRDRGIRFDGVEIRSAGEGAGNGVFALGCERANKNLIELPAGELLTAGRVADMGRYRRLIEEKSFHPNPFEMLVLFFYLEREEEGSEWTPYLRMLPSSFDTPVAQGLGLREEDLPLSVRRFWQQQREELESIRGRLPSLLSTPIDDNRLLWAWHVVNTRCIFVENAPHPLIDSSTVDDTIAVIPFVDMLNHSPEASCVAELDKRNGKYVVRLNKAIPEGAELHVCYGPHDNGRLWVEYGFRLEENPFTKVLMPTDLLLALAKKAGISIDIHHQNAVEEAALSSTLYTSDEGPSWAFRTNVRVLNMEHREIGKWRDIVYSEGKRRHRKRAVEEGEELSSDEEEPRMDEKTRERLIKESKTIERILGELMKAVEGRTKQVASIAQFLWKEQCELIERARKRVIEEIEELEEPENQTENQ
ncbi:hypothetical protein PENTCL1PPCAC_21874 [Pristionchus entomophagus]|uniref:SET domain-containing protein n=1 Tax=Pristionchus entomophagus TaxID=358040 RepID=A0AAV5U0K4_9BILA|nr:hypothetical protein PENTCL1PPCAC_21874 [Pristionchus entomophagus]